MDDDTLFENDDTIILTKDKIILQKSKVLETKAQKNRFKELDGTWELDIVDTTPDENNFVSLDDDKAYDIYLDMKNNSVQNGILSNVTYYSVVNYLSQCDKSKSVHDYSWESYEQQSLFGLKNPSMLEWRAHFMCELHDAYNFYYDEFDAHVGTPDEFIEFCFNNSDTTLLPLY